MVAVLQALIGMPARSNISTETSIVFLLAHKNRALRGLIHNNSTSTDKTTMKAFGSDDSNVKMA